MEDLIRQKAIDIMSGAKTAVVSSINEDGYPRAVTMSNIKSEGMKTMWFSTGIDSEKIRDYRRNSKASVCYSEDNNGITLVGDIEIIDDMDIKRDLWVDWFINHFPDGVTDPNYCILRFDAMHGVIWIDGSFEKFSID